MRARIIPIESLTGARFVAAILVILYHLRVIKFGSEAVTFFFILSGFVLAYNYGDGISSYAAFLNNRLARILPMHAFALLFATPLYFNINSSGAPASLHRGLSWLLSLFCLQVYWPATWLVWRWNVPSWSIACELFFYVIFPFILPFVVKRATTGRRILVLAGCALVAETAVLALCWPLMHALYRTLGFDTFDLAIQVAPYSFPLVRVGEFIVGIVLGCGIGPIRTVFHTLRSRHIALGAAVATYALIFYLGRFAITAHLVFFSVLTRYILMAPCCAVIVAVLASGKTVFSRFLESRPMVALGVASYSMYLLHYPIIDLVNSFHLHRGMIVTVVASTIAASFVTHRLLEEPARILWKNLSLRSPFVAPGTRSYAFISSALRRPTR